MIPAIDHLTDIGTYSYDLRTRQLVWSDAFKRICGVAVDEPMTAELPVRLCHPEDVERLRAGGLAAIAEGSAEFEYRTVRPDGSIRRLFVRANLLRDAAGEPEHLVGLAVDLTRWSEIEETRRATEELFFKAFSRAPVAQSILRVSPGSSHRVEVNDAYCELTGYAREELVGFTTDERSIWDDWSISTELRQVFVAGGHAGTRLGHLRRRDGEIRHVELRTEWILVGGEKCGLATVVDLTPRIEAEQRLAESEERFRRLSEGAFEGIVITEGGLIRDCNARLAKMFGYAPEALRGMPARMLIAPESIDAVRAYLKVETEQPYEVVAIRKDGSRFDVEIRNRMMPEGERRVRMSAVSDISERKRAERALHVLTEELELRDAQRHHSQKLEAIGQLAGGIAHDFNNLLTVINGYCERLLTAAGEHHELRQDLELVHNAGRRAAVLTRQLLAFSRRQVLQPRTIELNAIVRDFDRMLRRLIGESITVVTALDPQLGATRADPGQIEQVIMNLAINARDAMPDGGVLTIETANVDVDGAEPAAFRLRPGRYVSLIVRDTGHGMNEETLSHIFEPFFTTKDPGKGTGLGLPTVYGIVMQSGGEVAVETGAGRGTTMRVFLPRVELPVDSERVAVLESVPQGTETLLVVEDEELVRELVREFLESAGYRVLEAPDAEAALLLAEANRGVIDLLVTDVILPGMNGAELERRLSAMIPGLRTVFVSGYPGESVFREGRFDPGDAFLPKPFTRDMLTRKVRAILDGAPPGAASVMVIDEDEDIRRLLAHILRSAGYGIVEWSPAAADAVHGARVDVVIADVTSSPRCLTALQQLRTASPDAHIVLMAGAFGDSRLRSAGELGPHTMLQKPLNEQSVLEAVTQALKRA